ncbi:MAG: Riboflavin transporter [Candidatus Anoxychlamydiales bacterium]|nr:Riboflavin transporter [Candidatus Anoxychlamydiales bacterium]
MNLMQKEPNLKFGITITILAYFCFSICSTLVKILSPNFSIMQILFIQNSIALSIIFPYFYKNRKKNPKLKIFRLHLIRDLTGIFSFFCYYFAIKKINLVDATLLAYTAPFFTPIIWTIWTKEKMEKGIWWTIILGFIGIGFLLEPKEHMFQTSSFIGIGAGVLSSIALVSIKRLNQKLESLTKTTFYYFLVSSIVTLPFAIYQWKTPDIYQISLLLTMGILMAIGQLFLTIAYKHGTASFLSPLCYSTIIFIGIISIIFFNQIPSYLSLIGAILIILGGTISYILKIKPSHFMKLFEHSKEDKKHWWRKLKLHRKNLIDQEKEKEKEKNINP